MRYFFMGIFFAVSSVMTATDYYISSSGNDSNSGLSETSAWKSVSKVNSVFSSFQPGDRILFKKGDTFYGTLLVTKSGIAGSPITIGAYGTGNKPVITGFKSVTGWVNDGNSIFSASLSSEAQTNMVIVNGIQYGMGRYPDAGTNLKFESHTVSPKTISDTGIGDALNWTGAELVISKWDWILDRCKINGHSGDIFTYTDLGSIAEPANGRYYFIQNDLKCLTAINEWYHNIATARFSIYGDPSGKEVKVAAIKNILSLGRNNYILIDGLSFSGSIADAVYSEYGDNITIQNCEIQFSGGTGISIRSANSLVSANIIKNCNGDGLYLESNNISVTGNTISNIGLFPGQVTNGMFTQGIRTSGAPANAYELTYNSLQNLSYNGIGCGSGQKLTIRYNFINNACKILDDGGGIYIPGASSYTRTIENNIILNSGAGNALADIARGIYLDEEANGCVIRYNTVAGSLEGGIMFHRAHSNTVSYNTLYNNNQQMYLQAIAGTLYNNQFQNNILISKSESQTCLKCTSTGEDIGNFGIFNYNYYSRPIDDGETIFTYTPATGYKHRTLTDWRSFSGQDINSKISPDLLKEFIDTAEIDFYYNPANTSKLISLAKPMIDVSGKSYLSSITLLPYTSVVLFVDPTYAPPKVPTCLDATIYSTAPTILELTYNLTLSNTVPPNTAFTVLVNSQNRVVNSVTISDKKVFLNLSGPVLNCDKVTVSYSKPVTVPIQTTLGGEAESISSQSVRMIFPPLFVSSSIENETPGKIEINFCLPLANVVPTAPSFTVMVNGVQRTINSIAISGYKVILMLSSQVSKGDIVTVSYKIPSSYALRSDANIFVAGFSAQSVINNIGNLCPVLVRSSVSLTNPESLNLVFSQDLGNVIPAFDAFVVKVNSIQKDVTGITISGSTLILEISSSVAAGDLVTVSYRIPASNALRSVTGCFVQAFSEQPVTNEVQTACPVLISSRIENNTPDLLRMTFSINMANVIPSATAFKVMVNSVQKSVTLVSISGTDVILTLASPVVNGDVITVAYTMPSSFALRSVSWCFVLGFSLQPVINQVQTTCPVLVSSRIENSTPDILRMTFSTNMANVIPSATAFKVMVNSVQRSVNLVSISGTDVMLTLSSPVVNGDVLTVAYTMPSSNALRSVSWCFVLGFSSKPVTNEVQTACPVLVSSMIENSTPDILRMTFSTNMANVIPSATAFKVMVNSVQRSVNLVSISGTDVMLTLSSPVVNGDVLTVAYTMPSSNALRSVSWCFVLGFGSRQVTNEVQTTCPVLVSSRIENSTPDLLRMTFSTEMANVIPSATAFRVMVNSIQRSANLVSISGTDVMLTLSSPVVNGDVITVAYTVPSSYALRSVSWCFVTGFTAKPVTNEVLGTCPVLVSAAVEFINPAVIELTFNTTMANVIPSGSAFTVLVNSLQRAVSQVTISGTKVYLTLDKPVVYGDNITIAYIMPSSYALRSVSWCFVLGFSAQQVANKCLPASKSLGYSNKDNSFSGFTNSDSGSSSVGDDNGLQGSLISSDNINIYPNPASEFVNITFPEATDEIRILRIFDLSGKLCLESRISPGVQQSEIQINLRSGLYFVKIIQGVSTILTKQLVVL